MCGRWKSRRGLDGESTVSYVAKTHAIDPKVERKCGENELRFHTGQMGASAASFSKPVSGPLTPAKKVKVLDCYVAPIHVSSDTEERPFLTGKKKRKEGSEKTDGSRELFDRILSCNITIQSEHHTAPFLSHHSTSCRSFHRRGRGPISYTLDLSFLVFSPFSPSRLALFLGRGCHTKTQTHALLSFPPNAGPQAQLSASIQRKFQSPVDIHIRATAAHTPSAISSGKQRLGHP